MLDFLFQWRYLIIGFIGVIGLAIYDFQAFKSELRNLIFIIEGESKRFVLTNIQKEDWVVTKIEILFPKTFHFIGESNVRAMVAWIIKKAKSALEKGKIDKSVG